MANFIFGLGVGYLIGCFTVSLYPYLRAKFGSKLQQVGQRLDPPKPPIDHTD